MYHLAVPAVDNPLGASAVCLVSGELPPDPGGVGDYTARLAEALAAVVVPVGILTSHRSRRFRRRLLAPTSGTVAIPVWAGVRGWGPDAWPTVVGTLRRLGARPILHIQYQAGAFGLGGGIHLLPLWVRARLPRVRVVTTFHDFRVPYLFPKAGPLRLGAVRLLAHTSHAAIFTDPADRAAAGVTGQVIPIGSNVDCAPPPNFDRARARRWLGADEETLLVGYFGFLNRSKGVPTLVRAVASLAAAGRSVRLALIGAEVGASDPTDLAESRVVHALRAGLGLEGLVTITGYLPSTEISAALLACDLVALPYRDGASSRRGTLMAALAHGRPIVSTLGRLSLSDGRWLDDPPSPRDEPLPLHDGVHLLLVPPDDPEALTLAIGRLADDPALRARLAANAGALAARIAWPEIARRTLAVYEGARGQR